MRSNLSRVNHRLLWAATVVATMLSMNGVAAGLGFLKYSPMYYFTDRDRQLLREAAESVLKDPDANAVREWINPKNNYSGKVEGRGAYVGSDGSPCRLLRISTQAKGIENVASYSVCKAPDGDWFLAVGKH